MAECIVVTSGKGGVGKTTTSANLAVGLALSGLKVVVVDADIGLRNLDVILGLENRIVYDLVQVVQGDCKLRQALIRDKRVEGLWLLPAAQRCDKDAVTPVEMKELVEELKAEHDVVVIDCPAGIEQGFKNSLAGADRALIVTTPEVSAIRDADRVVGLIDAAGLPEPRLIINRYRPSMVHRGDMLDRNDILDILRVPLIGIVPESEDVVVSSNRGQPLALDIDNAVGAAYRRIVRRILGEEVPIPAFDVDTGAWAVFKRWMGLAAREVA
jgi:septum site-determining protein MinD